MLSFCDFVEEQHQDFDLTEAGTLARQAIGSSALQNLLHEEQQLNQGKLLDH